MFRAPRPLALLAFLPILVASPAPAPSAGITVPDLDNSYAEMPAYTGEGEVVLMILPDGSGPSFAEAWERHTGTVVDARIHLYVIEGTGTPVVGFPGEDIWLEPANGSGAFASCGSGGAWAVRADAATDAAGMTTFLASPRAGGWCGEGVRFFVNGDGVGQPEGLPLDFVSPDINGDLTVNLSDAGFFADDLFGDYHVRSDMNGDGILNLSDSGFLATAIGRSCP